MDKEDQFATTKPCQIVHESRERSLFTAGGGGNGGGGIELECKQLEGGGARISMHSFRGGGGGQNLSAETSKCHLRVTKNHS